MLEMVDLSRLGNTLCHTLEKKNQQLLTLQLPWVVEAMEEMVGMAAKVELEGMAATEEGAAMEV